jgi:hypothetical protein
MNALILLVCATLSDCQYTVQADNLGFTECLIQSQRKAAEYQLEHPKRKIKRIICTDSRRVAYYLGKDQA